MFFNTTATHSRVTPGATDNGQSTTFRKFALELVTTGFVLTVLFTITGNDLVWDDKYLLIANSDKAPSVLTSLTTPFWQNAHSSYSQLPPYWRPISTLVLTIAGMLGGNTPWGFHLLSVLVSIGAAMAIIILLHRLFPNRLRASWWVALFYLIHPVTVEVTCMAANVADHLALTFVLIGLISVLAYLRTSKSTWLVLTALSSFGACGSKEFGVIAVGAPILAWLLYRNTPHRFRLVSRTTVSLFLSTAFPVAVFLFLRHMVITQAESQGIQFFRDSFSLSPSLVFLSYGQAILQTFWVTPKGAHLYLSTDSVLPFVISAVVWAAAFSLMIYTIRKKTPVTELVLLLCSVPVTIPSLFGVISTEEHYIIPMRYFHLPLLCIVAGLLPFIGRLHTSRLRVILPGVVLLLGLLSFIRIAEWNTETSLFLAEVQHHPDSLSDVKNVCKALIESGRFEEAEEILNRYKHLTALKSREQKAFYLSIKSELAYFAEKNPVLATTFIQRALKQNPGPLEYVLWLAELRARMGYPNEALMVLTDAQKAPWYSAVHKKKIQKKINAYREAQNRNSPPIPENSPPEKQKNNVIE